jgi:hypothetical protein
MYEEREKDRIIHSIYQDYANFGSMQDTYKQAKAKNKSITMADVKAWYERNLVRKINLPGYNSFQVDGPKIEISNGYSTIF